MLIHFNQAFFLKKKSLKKNVVKTVLGLHFFVLSFSCCDERGTFSSSGAWASCQGHFSCWGARDLGHYVGSWLRLPGSGALGQTDLFAPQHVGSSPVRDGICVCRSHQGNPQSCILSDSCFAFQIIVFS